MMRLKNATEKAAKETEQKEAGNNNVSRKKEIKVGKFREKKEERSNRLFHNRTKKLEKRKSKTLSLESKSTFKCHNFLNINVLDDKSIFKR